MAQQQYISLDNKYSKIYDNLIKSRKSLDRKKTDNCYYENHHIIPRSLGGSNKKSNMVLLTPREHCIAHLLLVRMYEGLAKYKIFLLEHMSLLKLNCIKEIYKKRYGMMMNILRKNKKSTEKSMLTKILV